MKYYIMLSFLIIPIFFLGVQHEESFLFFDLFEIKKINAQEDDVLGGVGYNPQHEETVNYIPRTNNPNLKIEKFVSNLQWPTTMDFINDDILILEKNSGNVRLIKNGELQENISLNVPVNFVGETGLLGILVDTPFVYLYFTESDDSGSAIGNNVYKYLFRDDKLVEPVLIQSFPVGIDGIHNGGILTKNLDNRIFAIVGDNHNENGILQNNPPPTEVDNRGIIADINSGDIFAIGIRNSFGLTVDPFTGYLWDTENGNLLYDEINLVNPNFNSGWSKIMGPDFDSLEKNLPNYENFVYSDPEFSWEVTTSPTALSFVKSEFFPGMQDSLLVGDFNHGILYEFKLNTERNGFVFSDESLKDKIANRNDSINEITLGSGFNGITDIKVGPDGLIYVVSIMDGAIYRISPNEEYSSTNALRCEIIGPNVDLSNCDLKNKNLSNFDLSFSNLTKTDLSNSNLENVKIWNTNLSYSKLDNSNLRNVDIFSSNFSFTSLENAQLVNSKIRQSDFSNSNLVGANLSNSSLNTTTFDHSDMSNTNLHNSQINYVTFNQVDFYNANLQDIYPYSSNFSTASLDNSLRNSCFADNIIDRELNGILKNMRESNFILEPIIEWFIMIIC